MQTLREQLKKIDLEIDPVWKKQTRNFLLSHVRADSLMQKSEPTIIHVAGQSWFNKARLASLAWRPAMVVAMVVLFVFGGSGAIVARAKQAMPGDSLFSIKKMVEKTQSLTKLDAVNKTQFASVILTKRINELKAVSEMEIRLVSAADKKTHIPVVLAVREVENQVGDVNRYFTRLRAESEDKDIKVASTAFELNRKIRDYKHELENVRNNMNDDEVADNIQKALTKVDEVSNEVLAVLVDKHKAGILKEEEVEIVAQSLGEKVAVVKGKVDLAIENMARADEQTRLEMTDTAKEIQSKLAQAEEAMKEGEYQMVLSLANDSDKMLAILYGGDVYAIRIVNDEENTGEQGEATSTEPAVELNNDGEAVKDESENFDLNETNETTSTDVISVKIIANPVYSETVAIEDVEAKADAEAEEQSSNLKSDTRTGEFSVGIE